ncbi:MAG: hypothetical protein AAB308_04200 [Nitrospirota bacterium]
MIRTATVESAIRSELRQQGPCTLEALLARLPQFSWSEIFTVVDDLSREGRLVLRRPSRFDYEVSITPVQPAREQSDEGSGAEGNRRSDRGHPNGRPQIYEKRTAV